MRRSGGGLLFMLEGMGLLIPRGILKDGGTVKVLDCDTK